MNIATWPKPQSVAAVTHSPSSSLSYLAKSPVAILILSSTVGSLKGSKIRAAWKLPSPTCPWQGPVRRKKKKVHTNSGQRVKGKREGESEEKGSSKWFLWIAWILAVHLQM